MDPPFLVKENVNRVAETQSSRPTVLMPVFASLRCVGIQGIYGRVLNNHGLSFWDILFLELFLDEAEYGLVGLRVFHLPGCLLEGILILHKHHNR